MTLFGLYRKVDKYHRDTPSCPTPLRPPGLLSPSHLAALSLRFLFAYSQVTMTFFRIQDIVFLNPRTS